MAQHPIAQVIRHALADSDTAGLIGAVRQLLEAAGLLQPARVGFLDRI